MKKILILIIALISFFNQFAFATEEATVCKMDFYAAIKYSLDNNNNLNAMKHNLAATEKDIGIVRSKLLPKLRFLEEFDATNNPTNALTLKLNQARANTLDLSIPNINHPSTVTNFLTAGILEQTIYNRKNIIQLRIAKKEYSANAYIYLRRQEELVSQVAQACINIDAYKEYIKATELILKDLKEQQKITEDRLKNQKGSKQDVLRAKAAVAEKEQRLISYTKDLKVSKRKLGLLLGVENDIELVDSVPALTLKDINYYKDLSVYRNDIKATEIRLENAKNGIKEAQADWYPTLDTITSYNFYNNAYPFGAQGQNYILGAFFRWDIFDGNKRKYEILKAKEKQAEAREFLDGLRLNVSFEVYEAYSNTEVFQKNLELALLARKAAEEDTAIVMKKWQDSSAPFIDLIDAQSDLDDARINAVKSATDLKTSLINLNYESGIIIQEFNLD